MKPVRLAAITAYGLVRPEQRAPTLFGTPSNSNRLSQAMDTINSRFGSGTLIPASLIHQNTAPDRIGFGRNL